MSGKKSGPLASRRQYCENEFDNLRYSNHRCHPLLRAVWRDSSVQHDDVRVLPPSHHQPMVRQLSGARVGRQEQGQWANILLGYRWNKTRIVVKRKKLNTYTAYTLFTLTLNKYFLSTVNSSIYSIIDSLPQLSLQPSLRRRQVFGGTEYFYLQDSILVFIYSDNIETPIESSYLYCETSFPL